MSRSLDLGGIHLPLDAVTQTFGVLAVRGAGKSNLGAVMAEEMFAAGLPFVVVDPVGAWYGLRSTADGKPSGISIPIFGGKHGDVPLEETGGQVLADLVVDDRASCVLDVSELSEGAKIRFLIDFGERLYRRNTEPLHLFLEEADDYAPQKPFREQARLLRVWENVVRRGRARGLGITLITQRSAAVNKNVLTQVETLFVLRTTSPQDRKAIAAWVEYHGQSKEVLESLSTLSAGEAWVWSPQWLKMAKRVQIRRRATFDSGATPKNVRGARPAATLADVNLGKVRARMAATIERAQAKDPSFMSGQIAALKKEIKALEARASAKVEVERIEVPVIDEKAFVQISAIEDDLEQLAGKVGELHSKLAEIERVSKATVSSQPRRPFQTPQSWTTAGHVGRPDLLAARRASPASSGNGRDDAVTPARQKILDTLASLEAMGIIQPSKVQLALWCDVSPTSGGYFNNLGALRSAGLIDYPVGGTVALTEAGKEAAHQVVQIPDVEEMQEMLCRKVGPARAAILKAVIDRYPKPIPKDDLAELIGVSPTSGGYFNNLGALRTLGLIDYPQRGTVAATPVLFLEQ